MILFNEAHHQRWDDVTLQCFGGSTLKKKEIPATEMQLSTPHTKIGIYIISN